MSFYTRKEAEKIKDAYRNICALVGRYTGMEYALDNAVKDARRDYNNTTREAEARVIGAFLDGYTKGLGINAGGLYGLCQWYVMACITGAGYKGREGRVSDLSPYLRKLRRRALKMAREAQDAHSAARDRDLDRIMGRG
jgi:hypothetical protein